MRRGILTPEIQEKAKGFLHREITTTELRLYPYLDYIIKNEYLIDPRKINHDEGLIINRLFKEGHLVTIDGFISISKEFYNFINTILWMSYVSGISDEEGLLEVKND